MKFGDVLRGYVFPNNDQIEGIWKDADFCLDTNVLLDVYRYSETNRKEFLCLLGAIKGRVFVPNRVAAEFARNRISVIRSHFRPQKIIREKLDEALKDIQHKCPRHPSIMELRDLIESAKKLVDDRYREDEKKQYGLIADDYVLRDLLAVLGEEVGSPFKNRQARVLTRSGIRRRFKNRNRYLQASRI